MIRRQLINFQNRSVDVRVGLGAFDELSRMFSSAVGKPKRAMVVWNDATSERFGEVVEHALVDAGFAVSQFSLEVSPAGATLADADAIFGALSANGITCDDLVVAVGDAATCSVVSWCANQWCGRTECALLPTTFDAMLTVATTMKPLVASSANALPAIAFRPEPGLVVCDLDLVREADPEDLKLGYVVLVGTMLSSSKSRWNQFTETVPEILAGEEVALVNAVQAGIHPRIQVCDALVLLVEMGRYTVQLAVDLAQQHQLVFVHCHVFCFFLLCIRGASTERGRRHRPRSAFQLRQLLLQGVAYCFLVVARRPGQRLLHQRRQWRARWGSM